MLKYYDVAVTFAEFPDEIAVCVNITNCPGLCEGCSEPWLREDIGTPLTNEEIDKILASHQSCTVFGILGGDADHEDVLRVAQYVKEHSSMKVGFYSGVDWLDCQLCTVVDFYKIGRWIQPQGDPATWWKTNCGPLPFSFSNQLYFEISNGKITNTTQKFRGNPVSDLQRYVI